VSLCTGTTPLPAASLSRAVSRSNRSCGLIGLSPRFRSLFARTSTVPALCAGVTTSHVVIDVQLTEVAAVVPNRKPFRSYPERARAGDRQLVPPVVVPLLGVTFVTVGSTNL